MSDKNHDHMRFRFIIFLLFAFVPVWLAGQSGSGPVRVEFDVNAEVFQLVPCGEAGVLVFYETIDQPDEHNKSWFFVFYNDQLQPVWSMEVPILLDFIFMESFVEGDDIYLAYQKSDRSKADEYNFQFVRINLNESGYVLHSTYIPDRSELIVFKVMDGKLFAGFNYWKEQAMLLIRDLNTGEEHTVMLTDEPSFINDLKFIPDTPAVMLAVTIYVSRRESLLYLNSYDYKGNLLHTGQLVPTNPTEKLLNAQLHFVSENEFYVLGSFNNLNGKISKTEDTQRGEQSEGFYIASFENNNQAFINFYPMLDLKNFTKILNNQQLATATSMLKRQNRRGRDQTLNYDFLIHELIVQGDELIMLADAYYPEYRQVSSMSYDFYGRPMPYYYTVFDGYRYFNAFVVSFDKDGNLNWSNGMKIWDVRSMRLQRRTAFYVDGNDMVIFYNHDGKIVSKMIDGYQDVGIVENMKIATTHTGDLQLESNQGMVKHWYDDLFLAYGYQTLRNNTTGGSSRRKVFYVNKIMFD
jgi:hypothetical protein